VEQLILYDASAGKEGFNSSEVLPKHETPNHIPTIETERLRAGVIYYDGQFGDARIIINMPETAFEQRATLINYMRVTSVICNSKH
jgi:glycerol-3-phosphate dehydrogenase